LNRIKPKDIKPLRTQWLIEQKGLCALCQEPIAEGEAVLDHCHKTGQLRAVLHRGCNAYIGSLENNQKRNQITTRRLAKILAGFTAYVQTLKPILHSTYRTAEERAERAKNRAQKLRQKKRAKPRDKPEI
jgi:hypothetical protein